MKKYLFLLITLVLISMITIIIFGNSYTLKVNVTDQNNIDNIKIDYDKRILKITNKKINNNILTIKFKAISHGKSKIDIYNQDNNYYFSRMYVHHFGVITNNNYFGKTKGDIVIPISILILLVTALKILIDKYRNNMKKNLYQYKNINYLGLIIFLVFSTIIHFITLFNYNGTLDVVSKLLELTPLFSFLVLPIAFITSILVTISNIILVRKEGFSPKRILGLFLGLLICLLTITPNLLNDYLQTATWIDVHNESGLSLYIQTFIESFISVIVSYLECILLSTIILSIKAAKKIPEFNKDYIVILGCKINKDGSLTNLLKQRVDRAIEFSNLQKENTGKDIIFVPSGGKGKDEIISEAQAIKKYLVKEGIKEKNIIVEDKSTNTYENIKYSIEKINQKKNIAFSTTNYHVFRAGVIADKQHFIMEGIGSKTKSYFWINAFIREFIATLYSEKKKHIIYISIISIISIIMIIIKYLSVIL